METIAQRTWVFYTDSSRAHNIVPVYLMSTLHMALLSEILAVAHMEARCGR